MTSNGPDLSKMNPALQMKNGMNGNGAMAPPKSFGRDRTLGKTVTIRKGPYKGMLGIVKDATDTTARVELHSKSKVVNIDKDSLAIKEYVPSSSDVGIRPNIHLVRLLGRRWTCGALVEVLEPPQVQLVQASAVRRPLVSQQIGRAGEHQ